MRPGAKAILSRFLVVLAVLVFGTALTPNYAYAQGGGGGGDGYTEYFGNSFDKGSLGSDDVEVHGAGSTGLSGAIQSISVAMTSVLKVILGIGSLIILTLIFLRMLRGDREAATKLLWYMLAFGAGFIILTIMDVWHPTVSVSGTGYTSLKQEIATVLIFMTKIVAMISLTLAAINMMQGEQEGLKKFLVTLIVSLGVAMLISIVAGV